MFSTLSNFLGEQLYNQDFQKWLSKSLGFRRNRFFSRLRLWLDDEKYDKRGRPCIDVNIKQLIYDTYINNSIISVDRRNGRDHVTMSLKMFNKRYNGIHCSKVSISEDNMKVSAPRYASCQTTNKIRQIVNTKVNTNISYGIYQKLHPFF